MKYLFITLLVLSSITTSFGQDLLKERIRKLTTNKTSVYVEKGVFHNGANKTESSILSIRQNYSDKQGYERIVFDFSTNKVPKVYGYISSETQKISIDFFDTKINPNIKTIKNTKFLENLKFGHSDWEQAKEMGGTARSVAANFESTARFESSCHEILNLCRFNSTWYVNQLILNL